VTRFRSWSQDKYYGLAFKEKTLGESFKTTNKAYLNGKVMENTHVLSYLQLHTIPQLADVYTDIYCAIENNTAMGSH